MIDREPLIQEWKELNKLVQKILSRVRKLDNALRTEDDKLTELFLDDTTRQMSTYRKDGIEMVLVNNGLFYMLKKNKHYFELADILTEQEYYEFEDGKRDIS